MSLMSSPRSLAPTARWRAASTLWLVLALLWAPIWGQWHGIAHQVRQAVAAPTHVATVAASVVGDMDEGHTPGSALCQVLDHLGHAHALSAWPLHVSLLLLPAFVPDEVAFPPVAIQPCRTPPARAPPALT
jgi:hypothetical protein